MSTFDEREQAFEAKFQHDEELRFKILVRRAKLLGLWAASKMGLSGAGAEEYAQRLVEGSVNFRNEQALIDQVHADLMKGGSDISRHRVERHAAECFTEARRQHIEE